MILKNLILKHRMLFGSVIFVILTWFIFNFKLTEVPPGINGDEASIGYNAILLSRTLHDENGRFLPLFVLTLDGKDWKQPVTMYSTALAFRLFGPAYSLLRQVSIFYVLISAGLLFFLIKKILSVKLAVFGTLIFLATPAVVIQSHLALENIAPIPFVIFWLLMIWKYTQERKSKFLLWAGISLGISFYSYNGMRLIMPVLSGLTLIYLLYLNNFSRQKSFPALKFFILGILPFLIILPQVRSLYPGAIFGNNRPVTISSYQQFLLPYLSFFDPSFLFITGDSTPYHSTGKHGVYLLATLPLFLIGCIKAIQRKQPILILILASFLLAPILFGIVGSPIHRGSRLIALVPFYVIIATLGFSVIFEMNNKYFKRIILFFISIFFIVNCFDFMRIYWFEYPGQVREYFSPPLHLAFEKLSEKSQQIQLTPFIEEGLYKEQNVAAKFFEQVYFPDKLQKGNLKMDFPQNGIMLLRSADAETLEKKGLVKSDVGVELYNLITKYK